MQGSYVARNMMTNGITLSPDEVCIGSFTGKNKKTSKILTNPNFHHKIEDVIRLKKKLLDIELAIKQFNINKREDDERK